MAIRPASGVGYVDWAYAKQVARNRIESRYGVDPLLPGRPKTSSAPLAVAAGAGTEAAAEAEVAMDQRQECCRWEYVDRKAGKTI
jgi:hypothetical protein